MDHVNWNEDCNDAIEKSTMVFTFSLHSKVFSEGPWVIDVLGSLFFPKQKRRPKASNQLRAQITKKVRAEPYFQFVQTPPSTVIV